MKLKVPKIKRSRFSNYEEQIEWQHCKLSIPKKMKREKEKGRKNYIFQMLIVPLCLPCSVQCQDCCSSNQTFIWAMRDSLTLETFCLVISVSLLTELGTNGVVITPAIMRIPISEYHIFQMSHCDSETLWDTGHL